MPYKPIPQRPSRKTLTTQMAFSMDVMKNLAELKEKKPKAHKKLIQAVDPKNLGAK